MLSLILVAVSWVLLAAFWQLEVIYIIVSNPIEWGYNFAGFGDFGFTEYQWRDVWYVVLTLAYAVGCFAAFMLGREVEAN